MAKIRKESLTMNMYMEYVKDGDIREDADVQRASGQWTKEQMNELIVTVLTDGYIPPIFIGEDFNLQKWLLDGLQRTTSLRMFRFGNYKITSAIRNSIITYREMAKDDKGNPIEDENGDYVWNECSFDIKNKTYDELPNELKKQFNRFQIDIVTFEECTMAKMSDLILIYNNHTGMNAAQKSLTYISEFARNVKDIVERPFFIEYSNFTEKEKTKGTVERVVLETIMCMSHLDNWKKQAKQIATYLNANSSKDEFNTLENNLIRLEKIVTEDIKDIFNSKDSFIWLTFFNKFTKLGIDDNKFAEFLKVFKDELRYKEVDGKLFDTVDQTGSTKDKAIILAKLHILETLINEFLNINKEDLEDVNALDFVKENVKSDATEEDIEFYSDMLDDLTIEVDNDTKLLDEHNRPSLIALVGYACEHECDDLLNEWIKNWFAANTTYILNQKANYLHMASSLQKGMVG